MVQRGCLARPSGFEIESVHWTCLTPSPCSVLAPPTRRAPRDDVVGVRRASPLLGAAAVAAHPAEPPDSAAGSTAVGRSPAGAEALAWAVRAAEVHLRSQHWEIGRPRGLLALAPPAYLAVTRPESPAAELQVRRVERTYPRAARRLLARPQGCSELRCQLAESPVRLASYQNEERGATGPVGVAPRTPSSTRPVATTLNGPCSAAP